MDLVNSTEAAAVQRFLEDFAATLNTNNLTSATQFCLLPSIIIDDHSKTVLNQHSDIEKVFKQFIQGLNAQGIVKFVPEVKQTMRLSERLLFTNIRWHLYDQSEQLRMSNSSSYTLQKMPDQQFKIIITVIDDSEKELEKIFPLDKRA